MSAVVPGMIVLTALFAAAGFPIPAAICGFGAMMIWADQ